MKNRFEYLIFSLFGKLFNILGLKKSREFASVLTWIIYYIIPIRKKTVIDNLKLAYPSLLESSIRTLSYKIYKSFAITIVEIMLIPFMSRKEICDLVTIKNQDLINEKFKLNKGVILLSAHFGNWEFIAIVAALNIGIPFSVIVKPQRNPYVTEKLNKCRTRWGNKTVQLGISIRQIYKELLDKKIVAMVADQRGPKEGVRVDFFGKPVSVYTGPAALAIKYGAPVIFGVTVRQNDFTYETNLVEIPTSDLIGTDEEKIIELSQRHTALLESYIRKNPEQWLWMHKRWKY